MSKTIRTVFIGYCTPKGLDLKYCVVFKVLERMGCKEIEHDGDLIHVIPDHLSNEEVQKAIDQICKKHRVDLSTDFETLDGSEHEH